MLRAGIEMRNQVFLTLEQRHTADFANGGAGVRYYEELLSVVRDAEVPEAVVEFQRRFSPLLDPDGTRSRRAPEPMQEEPTLQAESRRGG
jgi:hypothetical protein